MKLIILFWRKLLEVLFRQFPLKDKVVFDNFGGRGMGDDPKYIATELLRRERTIPIYWIVDSKNVELLQGITPLRLKSFRYYYHVMTAKVLVDNIRHSHHLQKRKGQYYIQTWHATVPLKKTEQEVFNLGQYYIINAVRHAIDTDLMYSNNDFHKYRFENSFWYHGPVLKCDVPRMSVLLNTPSGLRSHFCERYGIDKNKKIVLYAPTFRGSGNIGPIVWDYNRVLRALGSRFAQDYVMLLRLHPNIVSEASQLSYSDSVIDVTDYPDMQEILAISDILITDYSSTMFDFGKINRPLFLYCQDLDDYCSNDRQLEFSMDELPFPVAKTIDELENLINNYSDQKEIERRREFYDSIGYVDSGHGAEFIADIIEKQLH